MVHLARKNRNGVVYLYLEERKWIDGKSKRIWQKYLGREDKIQEQGIDMSSDKVEYLTMEFGQSAALYKIAKKLDVIGIIDKHTDKSRDQNLTLGEYFLITTINRCISPVTKRRLGKWFKQDFLSTVFDIDPSILNSQTYWNHYQYLDEEKIDKIESDLIKNLLDLYDLDLSTLLFDPTNFFTYQEKHENNSLAEFGHSKENRNNLRLINLSLLCTKEFGIPLFHNTYEGNVQDAEHFKGIISKITERFKQIDQKIEEMILIFDKGNHSPEAFEDINEIELSFIASLRNSTQKDLINTDIKKFKKIYLPSNGKEVSYYTENQEIYGKERKVYVLLDPKKKKRAIVKFEIKLEKKLKEINEFLTKLNVKKWRKKENVEIKLESLIGKILFKDIISYSITGSYEQLEVLTHLNKETKEIYFESLGRSVIFTNLFDWEPVDIIQAFRDKYIVEDSFKNMKNPNMIAIRPMFHWSNTCIRAHVFSCVLGLLLLSLLRYELIQKKITSSYKEIMDNLSEAQISIIHFNSNKEPIYRLNKMTPLAEKMYKKLGLKSFSPAK